MAISDVELKNGYYRLYDSSGNKVSETHSGNVGELCGIALDFVVFLKDSY
jgi:hypothetical protein